MFLKSKKIFFLPFIFISILPLASCSKTANTIEFKNITNNRITFKNSTEARDFKWELNKTLKDKMYFSEHENVYDDAEVLFAFLDSHEFLIPDTSSQEKKDRKLNIYKNPFVEFRSNYSDRYKPEIPQSDPSQLWLDTKYFISNIFGPNIVSYVGTKGYANKEYKYKDSNGKDAWEYSTLWDINCLQYPGDKYNNKEVYLVALIKRTYRALQFFSNGMYMKESREFLISKNKYLFSF